MLLSGRLVPVLGADVAELAERLAERFQYAENGTELPRVAQYVAVMKGQARCTTSSTRCFDADAAPTRRAPVLRCHRCRAACASAACRTS